MNAFPVIVLMVALAVPAVLSEDADSMAGKSSVLLSFEETRFKKDLIKEMRGLLEKDSLNVVVSNHTEKGDLAKYSAADYNAVFVTNSGVNSQVRPWVVEWLETNESSASRIVLHTTQTREWEVKTPVKVDAITSASATGKVRSLASEYVAKLKSILKFSPVPAQE